MFRSAGPLTAAEINFLFKFVVSSLGMEATSRPPAGHLLPRLHPAAGPAGPLHALRREGEGGAVQLWLPPQGGGQGGRAGHSPRGADERKSAPGSW